MIKVKFTNDFHDSEVNLVLGPGGILTPDQVKRARQKLCGIPTCQCSGLLGQRGPRNPRIEVVDLPDGSERIFIDIKGRS